MAPLHCGGFRAAGVEIAGTSGGMPAGVDSRIKGKIRRGATCDARRRDGEMFSTRWRQAFYRCFRSSYRRNSTYSQSRCVHPWFRCSGVWASQVAPLRTTFAAFLHGETYGPVGLSACRNAASRSTPQVGAPFMTPAVRQDETTNGTDAAARGSNGLPGTSVGTIGKTARATGSS